MKDIYFELPNGRKFFGDISEAKDFGVSEKEIDRVKQSLDQQEKKQFLRNKIQDGAGDVQSMLGTVSDVSAYTVDSLAVDILAVNNSGESSYKAERIRLFEELNGVGWQKIVDIAEQWFNQRKAGEIRLPAIAKGIDKVFADVAKRSTNVADILQQAQ